MPPPFTTYLHNILGVVPVLEAEIRGSLEPKSLKLAQTIKTPILFPLLRAVVIHRYSVIGCIGRECGITLYRNKIRTYFIFKIVCGS